MYQEKRVDFTAIGRAIKKARVNRDWTREEMAEMVDLTPRTIMYIENKGQHPSYQKFYELMTLLNISVDHFFFSEPNTEKSSLRLQIETLISELDDKDYIVLLATIKGLLEAKKESS